MEIILKEDIVNLGYKDDIVKVKDGYGRNYLIPQGKAVIATESAKKVLAEAQRQRAHKLEKIKKNAQEMAAKLAAVEGLTIAAKASENGKIFGSVTNMQVAEALEKLGLEVDRKSIVMEPVKELGAAKAIVKLYKEIQAEVALNVVAEEE
ncbi:MAG: 50S ribosomal protein L9 [Bacteroidaceae bacterium]|nr:50S ribosomal protein L9 [Bacteroidaceae bacterium]